jgi:hypothetical protein
MHIPEFQIHTFDRGNFIWDISCLCGNENTGIGGGGMITNF